MVTSPIAQYLATLHERHRMVMDGKVADYIPELAKADPNAFGICIATRDGHYYEVGDTRQEFTIQSISKAFVYGLALEDHGEDAILKKIGVEPSGEAFNAISLKAGTGAPFNPMINAGAIATTGQVVPKPDATRIDRVLQYLSNFAGRTLSVDESVYRSESESGHRNRAIGWMLRNFGIIDGDPHDILEAYFQQCAIRVTCRDLAFMGATLANQGQHPVTRERAIDRDHVDNVLSVMSSCGMYDFSGEWIYRVGLPAKSGVGGGIIAVLPGQLGIGVYSPPLDAQGNSLRGIKVCIDLARDLSLHLFNPSAAPPPALRHQYDSSQVASKRRRPLKASLTLRNYGSRVRVMELQGELILSTIEPVLRELVDQSAYTRCQILDFRRVTGTDAVSLRLLSKFSDEVLREDPSVIVSFCNAAAYRRELLKSGIAAERLHADADAALEAAEDVLLADVSGRSWEPPQAVSLAQCDLFRGCSSDDIEYLEARLGARTFITGDRIVAMGDMASEVFVILSGTVEVRLRAPAEMAGKRVDVFSAGMSFGEMAFIDNAARSADVIALEAVECRVIDHALFTVMEEDRPRLKIAILESIAKQISANLRQANRQIAALGA